MKVRMLRRIVEGAGFARRGDVIEVSEQRGAQLIRRQLAEEVQRMTSEPGKRTRKASKEAAADAPTETRPSGSPTGQAITSSSLQPARQPRKRASTRKSKAAAK